MNTYTSHNKKNIVYYLCIFFILLTMVIVLLIWIFSKDKPLPYWPNFDSYLYINNKKIKIAIADTPVKRVTGFKFLRKVPKDSGILFIFNEENNTHCFWMKDTIVKLSIAFINKHKEIVQINDMTPLDTNRICPNEKILYALEVEQGYFQKNNIKVKDKIIFER